MPLNVKLESEIITSDSGVCTAATAISVVTFTVVRHLGNQEEVVAVDVNLQT